MLGQAMAQLVAAQRYEPEGRRFSSTGMIHWNNPQTPREMTNTNISWP
jgi:coproporphyrinogen III oxidase